MAEERTLKDTPKTPQVQAPKHVPVNAPVPGIQPKNTPSGRDAPQQGEKR